MLMGLPNYLIKKLQMVQNTAARVLSRVGKFEHISPTLKRLHWLPVAFRIQYKICLLTFNGLHGNGPQYINDMLTVRNARRGLRSGDTLTLQVPASKHKTLGDRAFAVAAPRLWNSLPAEALGRG